MASARLSQSCRKYHRWLGFFLAGIMAVYAISGILLIFRTTDFLKYEKTTTYSLAPALSATLNYFRQLTQLRKQYLTLVYGSYTLLLPEHENLYVYERVLDDETIFVALNFSTVEERLSLSPALANGEVLLNNYSESFILGDEIVLQGYQALVIRAA